MYKQTIIIIFLCVLTYSCSTLKEAGKALRNEKNVTTDEFLVKKNEPLTVPRNIEILPEPNTQKKKINQNPLKKILNETDKKKSTQIPSSSKGVENTILNAIKNQR